MQQRYVHRGIDEARPFRHKARILTRAQTPEDGADLGSSLFNSQFMGVLQQSLARQGADALTKGVEIPDEARISAVEEVLSTALSQSKQSLRTLQQWRNQIDAQIAAQEKQVDRMEFALSKARSDGALLKTLKEMVYENNSD